MGSWVGEAKGPRCLVGHTPWLIDDLLSESASLEVQRRE